jgi:hypothetical protein
MVNFSCKTFIDFSSLPILSNKVCNTVFPHFFSATLCNSVLLIFYFWQLKHGDIIWYQTSPKDRNNEQFQDIPSFVKHLHNRLV